MTGLDKDILDAAGEALERLKYDHRYCANCFRRLREVEMPTEVSGGKRPPSFFIGYAHPTEYTIPGVDTTVNPFWASPALDSDEDIPDIPVPGETYREKQVCPCGATHHRTRNRPLNKDRALEYTRYLSSAVSELRDEYLLGSKSEVEVARKWHHSFDALQYFVGYLKSKPRLQHRDEDLFRIALAAAMKRPSFKTASD